MIRTLRLVQGQAGPPFQEAEPLLSSPRPTVPVPGLTKYVSLTSWELHKRAPKNTFHVPQCSAKDNLGMCHLELELERTWLPGNMLE